MKLHLEAISSQVPEGRHAFVVVDGASWHQEDLNLSNVTLLKLPPYSPQLNPVERIWEWLKQKWLSNRSYKNYKEIVDACCEAWNKFLTGHLLFQKCVLDNGLLLKSSKLNRNGISIKSIY